MSDQSSQRTYLGALRGLSAFQGFLLGVAVGILLVIVVLAVFAGGSIYAEPGCAEAFCV